MFDESAGSALNSRSARLYAHYDFFGTIIPSLWLLFALFVTEKLCYPNDLFSRVLQTVFLIVKSAVIPDPPVGQEPTEASTLTFVLVVLIFLMFFLAVLFVLGELLNSISSLFLDSFVLRNYLGYPFEIFLASSDCGRTGHSILHERMLSHSYQKLVAANAFPLLILEGVALLHAARGNHLCRPGDIPIPVVLLLGFVAAVFHVGFPQRFSWRRTPPTTAPGDSPVTTVFGLGEAVQLFFLLGLTVLISWVLWNDGPWWLLLVPIFINVLIVLVEKANPNHAIVTYMKDNSTNVIYFLANVVGYPDAPSYETIDSARRLHPKTTKSPDSFYWMCINNAEWVGGNSFSHAYHLRSLYGMTRNLCSASGLALLIGLTLPLSKQVGCTLGMIQIGWFAFLAAATTIFLLRFLDYYAARFSRYVLRLASFTHEQRSWATRRVSHDETD
jgi:hypothetical protein